MRALAIWMGTPARASFLGALSKSITRELDEGVPETCCCSFQMHHF